MGDELDAGVPARGPGTKEFYITQSFAKAFKRFSNTKDADGSDMGDAALDPRGFRFKQDRDWNPLRGWVANRDRILALYDYYRDVYLDGKKQSSKDLLIWAGLGRMAGGAVVGGLDFMRDNGMTVKQPLTPNQAENLSGAARDQREKLTEIRFLEIGKRIFLDLAWQHEAFLDGPAIVQKLAAEHDQNFPAKRKYEEAWKDISSDDEQRISRGNKALLENEQFSIIQLVYDKVLVDDSGFGGAVNNISAFTNSIHPYHRAFLQSRPSGNVLKLPDRFDWIEEPGGMWPKWGERNGIVVMAPKHREQLVTLSMTDILRRNFTANGPLDPILLSGAP